MNVPSPLLNFGVTGPHPPKSTALGGVGILNDPEVNVCEVKKEKRVSFVKVPSMGFTDECKRSRLPTLDVPTKKQVSAQQT